MGPHLPNKLFATKYCFSFSLFLYFSIFFVVISRYHEFLQKSFYYYYFLFSYFFLFMKIIFIFSCSGMFQDFPECSVFRVLTTPPGERVSIKYFCVISSGLVTIWPGASKVPRSFSFRIVFFLVITAFFCFFIA